MNFISPSSIEIISVLNIPQSYQLCFFSDFAEIKPDGVTIPRFLTEFAHLGLLPSTIQEIVLPNPPAIRLRFSSPAYNEWQVSFESNRINIQKAIVDNLGRNMGDTRTFIETSVKLVESVIKAYPRAGSRMSWVATHLSDEISSSMLSEIYSKLLNPITYYHENQPDNWNIRQVARVAHTIGSRSEKINVITMVNRVQGEFLGNPELPPFDRIQVSTDINTHQSNVTARFSLDQLIEFMEIAERIRSSLIAQVEDKLNG